MEESTGPADLRESNGGVADGAGDPAADHRAHAVHVAGAALDGIDEAPLEEHAERFRAVHAELQDALSDTDRG